MPISVGGGSIRGGGVRGGGGILAMPNKRHGAAQPNFAGQITVSSKPFRSQPFSTKAFSITGVTKDSAGTALGSCVVELYLTLGDVVVGITTSDASGNYSFPATGGPYYIVAYKKGSPDVAGTTVNTLTGA